MIQNILNTIAILAATYAIAHLPLTRPAVASLPAAPDSPAVSLFTPGSFEDHTPPVIEPVALTIPEPEPPPEPKTQPVAAVPRPVTYTSYSACGPGGCGPSRGVVFRRGLFGRRR